MKRIEERMLNAVKNWRNMSEGNTTVNVSNHETGWKEINVYLFGNCIYKAYKDNDGVCVESFTLAGWNTVTTRSRLNALGVYVSQKNWEPIYNGKVISETNWYTV